MKTETKILKILLDIIDTTITTNRAVAAVGVAAARIIQDLKERPESGDSDVLEKAAQAVDRSITMVSVSLDTQTRMISEIRPLMLKHANDLLADSPPDQAKELLEELVDEFSAKGHDER